MPRESQETRIALVQKDVSYLRKTTDEINTKLSSSYVTKEEFDPIKKVVYGLVGLSLMAVAGALISLVVIGRT